MSANLVRQWHTRALVEPDVVSRPTSIDSRPSASEHDRTQSGQLRAKVGGAVKTLGSEKVIVAARAQFAQTVTGISQVMRIVRVAARHDRKNVDFTGAALAELVRDCITEQAKLALTVRN